jgi:hypothetical protein
MRSGIVLAGGMFGLLTMNAPAQGSQSQDLRAFGDIMP